MIRDSANDPDAAYVRRMLSWLMLGGSVLAVLFCGMFPFDFAWHSVEPFDHTLGQLFTAGDGLENVVFFLPLGFALGAVLYSAGKRNSQLFLIRGGVAVLCSALLSALVENSQKHLVSRDPSLSDIFCNTIGGSLGFLVFVRPGDLIMTPIVWTTLAIRRIRDTRLLIIPAVLWMALVLALPVHKRRAGSLANWNTSAPLRVGNEPGDPHGWKGSVTNIWLGDRMLTDPEFERILGGGDPEPMLAPHLLAAYHLDGPGPYIDSTGQSGPLAGNANHSVTEAPVLRTDEGAVSNDRIARRNAFAFIVDVATADLNQNDQARIISISENNGWCNLQLLQDLDNLIVRVRSIGTGLRGMKPDFTVPGIFADTGKRRIVINYDNGWLLVGCDRVENRYTVRLGPEAWLIWRIYPRLSWRYRMDSPGQSLCGLMYRGLVMLPLGLLVGMISSTLRRRGHRRSPRVVILIAIAAASLLLEGDLLVVCGSRLYPIAPAVTVLAGLIGAVVSGWKSFLRQSSREC